MSSRIRHVINNDNPETLQISQFYAKYCNPTITAISATITTSTKTTTTTPATTTTTTPATTATTTKSAISARSGNKQSDACICSRNRKTFRKTWDSTFHHLSLPGMIHYPEFHFIIPISHKRSVTTTKDHSFPDLTQKMADGKRSLQYNENAKRVTVIDRPGQDKVHFTGARTRHKLLDVLKEFVSF
uniref:Uncharacterized protein n=1 Tax=Onchocerca volvulus TaxID=6282 RepID=A0A8R1XW81_ONCVO